MWYQRFQRPVTQAKENTLVWLFALLLLCTIGSVIYFYVACGRTAASGALEMFEATMDMRDRLIVEDQEAELDLLYRPVSMTAMQVNADGTKNFYLASRTRQDHLGATQAEAASAHRVIERTEAEGMFQRTVQSQTNHHDNQINQLKTQIQANKFAAEMEAHRRRGVRGHGGAQTKEHYKSIADTHRIEREDKRARAKGKGKRDRKYTMGGFGVSTGSQPRTHKKHIPK